MHSVPIKIDGSLRGRMPSGSGRGGYVDSRGGAHHRGWVLVEDLSHGGVWAVSESDANVRHRIARKWDGDRTCGAFRRWVDERTEGDGE